MTRRPLLRALVAQGARNSFRCNDNSNYHHTHFFDTKRGDERPAR